MEEFLAQTLFTEFEAKVLDTFEKKSNLLILTVPGLGITRFVKEFINKYKNINAVLVNTDGEQLKALNFLDLDFEINDEAVGICDNYLKKAEPSQKFVVIVNDPHKLTEDKYKRSYTLKHIYDRYYFSVSNPKDCSICLKLVNKNLSKNEIDEIIILSGGIIRIAKYLAVNSSDLSLPVEEIIKNINLITILKPTLEVIARSDNGDLEKIGIKKDEEYVSPIIKSLMGKVAISQHFDININSDMSVSENGEKSEIDFLKTDREILTKVMENRGTITKEEVADIKWGNGSYDEYSDQAIGKTMQRLKKKLKLYTFEVVPQLGYKLIKK